MRSIESLLSVLRKADIVSPVFISADIAFCLPVKIQQQKTYKFQSSHSILKPSIHAYNKYQQDL